MGDPNIVPEVVGSLLSGPQSKVPLIFENSQWLRVSGLAGFVGPYWTLQRRNCSRLLIAIGPECLEYVGGFRLLGP